MEEEPPDEGRRYQYAIRELADILRDLEGYAQQADGTRGIPLPNERQLRWIANMLWNIAWREREIVDALAQCARLQVELEQRLSALEHARLK